MGLPLVKILLTHCYFNLDIELMQKSKLNTMLLRQPATSSTYFSDGQLFFVLSQTDVSQLEQTILNSNIVAQFTPALGIEP